MNNFMVEYLYTLIYVVALTYVISLTYTEIRKEATSKNIIIILIYTFILNVVTYSSPHSGWFYIIGNIMCISLDFIYCGLITKKFLINNIFITTTYYVVQLIMGSMIVSLVLELLGDSYHDIIWGNMRFIFPLLNYVLSAVICRYGVEKRDFINQQLPKKYLYSFCLINIVEVIIILFLNVLSTSKGNEYEFFILVLAGIQMIMVNNYIIGSSRVYLRNKELELANYAYVTTHRHIKELEKEQERLYKFKHDINNHLQILEDIIGVRPETAKYLESIKADLNKPTELINTGNIFVDACLNTKIRNNEDINFKVDAAIKDSLNISQDKLCSLLFNLIDNAIEAAVETVEKKVEIKIFSKEDMLLISVINSVSNPINYDSKKGKYHGKGMIIIKEVVETYNGTMECFYKDKSVHFDILLNITPFVI